MELYLPQENTSSCVCWRSECFKQSVNEGWVKKEGDRQPEDEGRSGAGVLMKQEEVRRHEEEGSSSSLSWDSIYYYYMSIRRGNKLVLL